ncbi:basic proline-rich protein-like [Mustela erminea]|uniref:basic proline-rich protein-like n=1 Tax=Mustela erminea TaxID=36723 RepID=UPI0013869437|nr:basic proline-rich protein-like [Mustela erminea]
MAWMTRTSPGRGDTDFIPRGVYPAAPRAAAPETPSADRCSPLTGHRPTRGARGGSCAAGADPAEGRRPGPDLARGRDSTTRRGEAAPAPRPRAANERPPHSELRASSNGLSAHSDLPNFALSSRKRRPLFVPRRPGPRRGSARTAAPPHARKAPRGEQWGTMSIRAQRPRGEELPLRTRARATRFPPGPARDADPGRSTRAPHRNSPRAAPAAPPRRRAPPAQTTGAALTPVTPTGARLRTRGTRPRASRSHLEVPPTAAGRRGAAAGSRGHRAAANRPERPAGRRAPPTVGPSGKPRPTLAAPAHWPRPTLAAPLSSPIPPSDPPPVAPPAEGSAPSRHFLAPELFLARRIPCGGGWALALVVQSRAPPPRPRPVLSDAAGPVPARPARAELRGALRRPEAGRSGAGAEPASVRREWLGGLHARPSRRPRPAPRPPSGRGSRLCTPPPPPRSPLAPGPPRTPRPGPRDSAHPGPVLARPPPPHGRPPAAGSCVGPPRAARPKPPPGGHDPARGRRVLRGPQTRSPAVPARAVPPQTQRPGGRRPRCISARRVGGETGRAAQRESRGDASEADEEEKWEVLRAAAAAAAAGREGPGRAAAARRGGRRGGRGAAAGRTRESCGPSPRITFPVVRAVRAGGEASALSLPRSVREAPVLARGGAPCRVPRAGAHSHSGRAGQAARRAAARDPAGSGRLRVASRSFVLVAQTLRDGPGCPAAPLRPAGAPCSSFPGSAEDEAGSPGSRGARHLRGPQADTSLPRVQARLPLGQRRPPAPELTEEVLQRVRCRGHIDAHSGLPGRTLVVVGLVPAEST